MQYDSYAMRQLCNESVMQNDLLTSVESNHLSHPCLPISPANTVLCPGQNRSVLPMGWQHTTSAGNNKQGANINWRHGQLYWRYPQNWRFSQNWRSPKRSPKILAILRKSQKYWRFC